jgi:hypothetical protein
VQNAKRNLSACLRNSYIRACFHNIHVMKCLYPTIVILCSLAQSVSAQVNVFKDDKIDQRIQQNAGQTVQGFRIMISFDSNKDLVDQARNKFVALYPKIDTYVTFEAPNFVLKVGDFKTQFDAERLKEKISTEFSISIIQKESINLPRID